MLVLVILYLCSKALQQKILAKLLSVSRHESPAPQLLETRADLHKDHI